MLGCGSIPRYDIIDIANKKREKRGGFEKKIFLEKKLINDNEKDDE